LRVDEVSSHNTDYGKVVLAPPPLNGTVIGVLFAIFWWWAQPCSCAANGIDKSRDCSVWRFGVKQHGG